MKSLLKAALFGAIAALAVFFIPFVFPLLLLLLVIGLLRRAFFGRRFGPWNGGPNRWAAHAQWGAMAGQPVAIDGRQWQRVVPSGGPVRDVEVR